MNIDMIYIFVELVEVLIVLLCFVVGVVIGVFFWWLFMVLVSEEFE